MSKLILKLKQHLPYNEIERLEDCIKRDLDENGFAIIDDKFDIYEIETEEKHRAD